MIELQGLQHIGYVVFAIVIAYSVWVAILFEKNKKHQHTIIQLLEKLQGFENEVDQYMSTCKDQMSLIARLNQEIYNLKLEPLTLEKAYKEAMDIMNVMDDKIDMLYNFAWELNMEIEAYEILTEDSEFSDEDIDKIITSHVGNIPSKRWRSYVSEESKEDK